MSTSRKEPGSKAKAAGGLARAKALTPERKKEIALRAAVARWGDKPLQATHRGNFEGDFGIDVDCYVLNDAGKTAVISQRGMGSALGLTSSGQAFNRFAAGKSIAPYLGAEVQEKIANPLKFQWVPSGAEKQPPSEVYGYDVTLLIDICKAIVTAESEGKLHPSQGNIAKQAHIVLGASAKAGIKGLVYALSGYDATREEVITAFKLYIREEAREYEREFPPQLYEEWYRLYKLPKPERNKPWKFRHLTIEHVYKPLANSSGKVLDMTRQQREDSGDRSKKLHQFLSEVGVKALRTQLGQLLGVARVSKTQQEYETFVNRLFGNQKDFFE